MKTLIPNSYQELFDIAKSFDDIAKPTSDFLLQNMGFKTSSLNAQAPIFYAGDYTQGKYLYLDPSCEILFGFDREYIANNGHSFYNSLIHPDDYNIFNKQIFPESIKFLKKQPPSERLNFSCSYNYRVKVRSGKWLSVLQRGTYFLHPTEGKPLASVGFIIDITHFKDDTKIVHTIERIDRTFSVLAKEPVYKALYYPQKENGILSRREMEILQMLYKGLSSKAIASALKISNNTVVNHRKNMLRKTLTNNVTGLIHFALQNGLI